MVICFDLGGVLVRICRDWNEGCVAAGIEPRIHRPKHDHDDRARALIARYQRGASNAGYHYLGCAKTMAGIGNAFAEAILAMQR